MAYLKHFAPLLREVYKRTRDFVALRRIDKQISKPSLFVNCSSTNLTMVYTAGAGGGSTSVTSCTCPPGTNCSACATMASGGSGLPTIYFSNNTPAIPNPYPVPVGMYYPPEIKRDPDGVFRYHVQKDQPLLLALPDGAVLDVKDNGSYELIDKNAKITYRASRLREFNPYLNASDKLEAFIKYCGSLGVKKHEMLNLPINLFIAWLIIESAKADEEPEPVEEIKLLEDLRKVPDTKQLAFNFDPPQQLYNHSFQQAA